MKGQFAVLSSTLAFAFFLAAPVSAQPANHNASGMREACAADQKQYCGDAQPGMQTMQCMQRNAAKMSDGCKAAMTAMRGQGMGGAQGNNPTAGGGMGNGMGGGMGGEKGNGKKN